MGREDVAVCHWQGDVAEARLHLDSQELTLRGGIRASIARSQMREITLCEAGVVVRTDAGDLQMEFSPVEAARWQKALLKTPPTLAEKLGVSMTSPAFVLGGVEDRVLAEALVAGTVDEVDQAAILLAVILDEVALHAAADLALAQPGIHIWMIYRKGKAAIVGDAAVRTHMRALGFIDSKSCAVSDQLTATRYRLRDR